MLKHAFAMFKLLNKKYWQYKFGLKCFQIYIFMVGGITVLSPLFVTETLTLLTFKKIRLPNMVLNVFI